MKLIQFSRHLLVLLVLLTESYAFAQGFDPSSAIDIPSSVGQGNDLEHVDLMSGAVVVKIPLLHMKGRGIDTDVVATYTSKLWSSSYYDDPYNGWWVDEWYGQGSSLGNGWSIGIPGMIATTTGGQVCSTDDCSQYMIVLEQIHRFDGSTASVASQIGYLDPYGPLFSYDGSYIKQVGNGFIMRNGSRIQNGSYQDQSGHWLPVQILEDANGNEITCKYSQNYPLDLIGTCTDTLGRTLTFGFGVPPGGYYPIQTSLSYVDSNGTNQTITFTYSSIGSEYPWIDGDTPCGNNVVFNCVWNSGGGYVLSAITLPNGASYHFEYADNGDGTTSGELTKITLPTGGYVRYDYTTEAWPGREEYEASDRVIAHRYVSPDGTTEGEQRWTYSFPGTNVASVTDPQGNVHTETYSDYTNGPDALSGQSFPPLQNVPLPLTSKDTDAYGGLLQELDQSWTYDSYEYSITGYTGNPELSQTLTTIGGSPQQSIKTFSYSHYGNVAQENDYDWASAGTYGNLLRSDSYTYLADTNQAYTADNVHILDRISSETITGPCNGTSGTCNQIRYTYDGYNSGRLAAGLRGTSGVVQHDYSGFSTSNTLRGNVTQTVIGNGIGGGSTTVDYSYSDVGNVLSTMDGNGNVTSYDYTDNYYGSQPAGPTLGLLTKITMPSTNGVQHIERSQYYLGSGLVAAFCGENFPSYSTCAAQIGGTTPDYAWLSYDAINRPLSEHFGDGGSTTLAYNDLPLSTSVTETRAMSATQSFLRESLYDGLGRETRSEILSDPGGTDLVDTAYDSLGRISSVSNPYHTPSDSTFGYTTYTYDGIGRQTYLCNPDNGTGAGPCLPGGSYQRWSYSGNVVTFTDESGSQWQRTSDALGRLTMVLEPGSLRTTYSYDAIGNLLAVNQMGNGTTEAPRNRSFTYDSRSLLLSANNPESGITTYTYDASKNLQSKTDARGIKITYSYDSLNRLNWKNYWQGSTQIAAPAGFGYDGKDEAGNSMSPAPANAVGRLSHSSNEVNAAENYSYDAVGRLQQEYYCTPQNCSYQNSVQAGYDLLGDVISLTYPDGSILARGFNDADRLYTISLNYWKGSYVGTNMFTATSYDASGHLTSGSIGNGMLTKTADYNARLEVGSLAYNTTPETVWSKIYQWTINGNLATITDPLRNTTRQFSYDGLSRLTGALDLISGTQNPAPGGLSENFGYDSFGNMSEQGSFTFEPDSFSSLNRPLPSQTWQFDSVGNLVNDGLGNSYTWDPEGRLASANGVNYTYNAGGDRVAKQGSSPTDTIYFGGEPLARLSSGVWTDLIYDEDGLLAEVPSTNPYSPAYRLADHLGSSVGMVTSPNPPYNVQDYAPFGQLFNGSSNQDQYKFSGKERDAESGNDYFGARYYASVMGRFISPDPDDLSALLHSDDPQSWNGYSYARNNPLRYTDPSGTTYTVCDPSGNHCTRNMDDKTFEADEQADRSHGEYFQGHDIFHFDANGQKVIDGHFYHTDQDMPGDAAVNIAAMGRIGQAQGAVNWFMMNEAASILGGFAGWGLEVGGDAVQAWRAARIMANVAKVGQEGEDAVRAIGNIGPKTIININGRERIPDGLTQFALNEVKNVRSLSLTRQLQDFLDYAGQEKLRFNLWVPKSLGWDKLSGPLQDAILSGKIELMRF